MEIYDFVAQAIGVVAMAFNVLSFQLRSRNGVILLQSIGAFLFSVNFFMLGAYGGCILNIIVVLRSLVFFNAERTRARHPLWTALFVAAYIGTYVSLFTLFGVAITPVNLVVESLTVIGMCFSHAGLYFNTARHIRFFGIGSSPLWLVYNVINFAVGAIVCESLNIISIAVGILRHDVKRKR